MRRRRWRRCPEGSGTLRPHTARQPQEQGDPSLLPFYRKEQLYVHAGATTFRELVALSLAPCAPWKHTALAPPQHLDSNFLWCDDAQVNACVAPGITEI